ncbi:MTH1187 family thiamine-binding protein [Desulforamulus aquiferis]|uniref:MTH1187 family thiamine-binding protein n=1 Tax=Desulforamulus aquiferis TaxID=1397668 RepID=A0AAW7ZFT2_9FIRM|nr:MTH1187 family thiamine-binding protein [Desulforamulus aquiferis]MDO7788251.1 MTH1187 family thiamine-binding protein [Desulforamulus aquiferis]RYD03416.1 hypothetical protein N752_19755 [Desulforamulus aquiferis]
MALVEITVIPLGTGSTSLSDYVAGCLKVLEQSEGVKYQLTPMGTVIEGDLPIIMGIIANMHEQPFLAGASRVSTTIRIDDRRDKEGTMESKVLAVQNKIIRPGGTD